MAKQTIDVGTAFDDPSATLARPANVMINENFDELYARNIDSYGSIILKKWITITNWNMDTTASKQIVHGLGDIDVYGLKVIIRSDGSNAFHSLDFEANGSFYATETTIELSREDAGLFDGANYDATGVRGWIELSYVEQ